jgi:hypothetical protein
MSSATCRSRCKPAVFSSIDAGRARQQLDHLRVISAFEEALTAESVLAAFIPLLMGSGGMSAHSRARSSCACWRWETSKAADG